MQGPDEKGNLMMEEVEPIPITSGATLGRTCSNLRPPAVVTEFMSQGSVKSALARKSEVVVGNMPRVVAAMDAAKVRSRDKHGKVTENSGFGTYLPTEASPSVESAEAQV